MKYNLTYKRFSERAILIQWPSEIDENILQDLLNLKNSILKYSIKQKVYVVNTYNSLLVVYELAIDNVYDEILRLKSCYLNNQTQISVSTRCWEVPVCYDDEFAPDLEQLSIEKSLSKSEIIQGHSSPTYTIFFIGFLPGFLYLGGLHKSLHINRKTIPNLNTKKGAVGIGGKQTGIYPQNSPGGWHIIGNSPINMFDVKNENPCFAKTGDKIKFRPIATPEYLYIKDKVEENIYKLKFKDI